MIYQGVELYNVEALTPVEEPGGYLLSRIPHEVRVKLNPKAQITAFDGCGCELRFNLEGEAVKVTLARMPEDPIGRTGLAEVYYGSFQGSYLESPRAIGEAPQAILVRPPAKLKLLKQLTAEHHLPYAPELVRIILPYDWRYCLLGIEGSCSPPRPEQAPRRKLLVYGSSITHGGVALHPTGTYAMRLARLLEADLINLSFAGSALLEAEMAEYISQRTDWELATLELGINVVHSWPVEEFARKVDYFISTVAERNRDKWIFCLDLFTSALDYTGNPKAGEFRTVVREKVASLNLPKLVYLSGRDLLTGVAGLSADLLHPSAEGMEEIAGSLYRVITAAAPELRPARER